MNGDDTVDRVARLRTAMPDAFHHAVTTRPAELRDIGERQATQILAHVDGTWRPDLDRDRRQVLPRP